MATAKRGLAPPTRSSCACVTSKTEHTGKTFIHAASELTATIERRYIDTNVMSSGKKSGESGYIAPELRVERERSSLELEELTNLLDSGETVTEIRRRMCELDLCVRVQAVLDLNW